MGFNEERRRFLGSMSLSLAGIAAGDLVPVSLLQAAPQRVASAAGPADACGDWQLDDICLAYPPYAYRSGALPAHTQPAAVDLHGADWHWIA
ncbi:MAG: hypothetical protein RL030_349 [Pseudomonadota bacterium]|jgi:hypothetical protein